MKRAVNQVLKTSLEKWNTFYCRGCVMSLAQFCSKDRMPSGEWQMRKGQLRTKNEHRNENY